MSETQAARPGTPAAEAARRRTFAIMSHPDAGKTTLTEHLLLLGGAIRAAGAVKARGEARRGRSAWVGGEREGGVSVTRAGGGVGDGGGGVYLLGTAGGEGFFGGNHPTAAA